MKATVHKLIELEHGMTAKEVVDAIKAVVKQEGRKAWGFQVVITMTQEAPREGGLQTGQAASFPNDAEPDGIGFKRK